ncbi:MAG: prepilin-type N-terminal cleavage/methylation domain-containing protein, partial [Patescibacteria group bacterium]
MKTNRGQSLLEAILALAIFALIVSALAAMTIGGYQGLSYGTDYLEASALADEALEAARSVRDGAWNEFIISPARVSTTTGQWTLIGAPSETIGKFIRTLTFAPVCRETISQNIASCSGNPVDLHSKLASTTVTWQSTSGVTQEVKREAYLTNWDSREWAHTDWTGLTGTNVDTSFAGQLTLAGTPAAWKQYSPSPVSSVLNDVYCFAEDDCWGVGVASAGEVILDWNGVTWTRIAVSPTLPDSNLNAIFCAQPNDCWAVGNNSSGETLLRWNGSAWSRLTPIAAIPNANLNSVYCTSTTNCWAVGAASGGETILRWTG